MLLKIKEFYKKIEFKKKERKKLIKKDNKKNIHLKYFFLLLIAVILFTFPVVFNLFSKIPGEYADTYQVWGKSLEFQNIFEEKGFLKTLIWQFQGKRFTPIEVIGWLQIFTNSFVGYNLVWLFSFFCSAIGMYWLVFYLTRSRSASFLGGVIFAFSPFHIMQGISTNIGTMHYEWIPFFVLFLIKFLRALKLYDFLLMILFLSLIAFSEHHLLAFTLIFTLLFCLFFFLKNSELLISWRLWAYVLFGALVIFLATKFIFGGLLEVAQSEDNYLDPGIKQVERYSADGIELFLPPVLNPLWGEKFNYLRERTLTNNLGKRSNYIGFTVLLLSVISLFGFKKRWGIKLFFFFSALFFSLLCLGPILHWKGVAMENIWMPYRLFYEHFPYWYIIRTVNRIFIIAIFCFALSASFGFNLLTKLIKKESKKVKSVLFFGVITLISLEYVSFPIPTMSLEYSKFYDVLREEKENYSVIDIPGSISYEHASRLMFYNQIHQKNNFAGLDFARVVEGKWDFQRNTPVLYDLLYSLPSGGKPPSKEIIADYYYNLGTKILNYYNIRYIIVSKVYRDSEKKFNGEAFENTLDFIYGQLDAEKVYEDGFLVAFKVNQSEHLNGWFLAMDMEGDCWGKKEGEMDSVSRWAKDGARLKLVNMGDSSKNLRIIFKTRIKTFKTVAVLLNGALQKEFEIKQEKELQEVDLFSVQPGENEIMFRIYDENKKPVDTLDLNRGVKFSEFKTLSEGEN